MSIAFRDLPVYDNPGATRNFEQLVALKLKGSLEGTLDEPILRKEIVTTEKLAKPEAFKQVEALGFKNAWKNFEAKSKAEYRKNPFGTVELRGVIASGESGKEAFTLPAGYRPKDSKAFVVAASAAPGEIEVSSGGVVTPFNFPGSEVKTDCFLDGVAFSVE